MVRLDSVQRSSALAARRTRSVESYRAARECIGEIEPGLALFAMTRGQFSMLDAITACLDQVGAAEVSIWTWTVAAYELDCFERFARDGRITKGLLVIDGGARAKNAELLRQWQCSFGAESVRYVLNHSKVATIRTDRFRLLLRGSMNLNFNPRFEQLDITEGGGDFQLVKEIEGGLPVLPMDASGAAVYKATNLGTSFGGGSIEDVPGFEDLGEVTELASIDIERELLRDNPHARLVEVRVFADALRTYHEASENIRGNGAIVVHPKTGAPIENPYLKVQKQAGDVLSRGSKKVKSDRVVKLLLVGK